MADWREPLPEDQRVWHLLNRVTFGPRPGDVARVEKMGAKAFLEEQFHPEGIDDSAVERKIASLPTLSMSSEELAENFPAKNQAQQQAQARAQESGKGSEDSASAEMTRPDSGRDVAAMQGPGAMQEPEGPRRITVELAREQLWRAIYSQRQLEEVMVQFWMNHFNIFAGKGADRWLITSFERQAIRPHALGKFGELLVETAKSPAMLFYLDNWLSVAPYTTTDGSVYRPLAKLQNRRGLNENYARELMELHTMGVEGGYTQHDVREVARCFTGWTIHRPLQGGSFFFNPRLHDFGEKVVLRHKIKPGGGEADGHEVLHLLAHHPSTARFISRKLAVRFVADNPPQSLIDKMAKTFTRTDGDIREVLKTMLESREFWSEGAWQAKVKSPLEMVAGSLRALDAQVNSAISAAYVLNQMGEPLYRKEEPTGYSSANAAWMNSAALLSRMNFALGLVANRIPGIQVDVAKLGVTSPDDPKQMARALSLMDISEQTRSAIAESLKQKDAQPAATMAGLLLGSPEFQRR